MKIVSQVTVVLLALGFCGCTWPRAGLTSRQMETFSERIHGSLVSFEMIPVPGNGKIKPFWIGKTEVTWDEFDIWAFRLDQTDKEKAAGIDAESRPSQPYGAPDRGFGHQGFPAIAMTHEAAEEYCRWLSRKTGHHYRLPTDAEWEIACRDVGVKASLESLAWFSENAEEKTHAVATKQPNALGICDMAGNVAEWCTTAAGKFVVRGGSFVDSIDQIGCGARKPEKEAWKATDPQDPKSRWWLSDAPFVGFRVVREP
jgi:formylglycine-generating enzyme required for sulfatase activity